MAQERKAGVEPLERGNIYFFYRPKVEEEHPDAREDVQRLYVVFSPHGSERYRLSIIGRKQLPDPDEMQQRMWGFVDAVVKDPKRIVEALSAEEYETKTTGKRHQPAARPAGEGVYRILSHGDHTHLVYALELPEEPDEVQRALEIEKEASYILSIKNPEKPAPKNAQLGSDKEADYPRDLSERFRGRRFAEADPPRFMDYEGSQFVLISASEDVSEELGIELEPHKESESSAEIFSDLQLEKSRQPVEPLFGGEWR